MGFFIWIEDTALSAWIRETPSLWGFPFILYLHTLGLALLAGLSSALAIWLLMNPDARSAQPLHRFFPLMWLGFGINAVSGLLLLITYPAKALTNPVFYIKLVAIFAAVAVLQWIDKAVFLEPAAVAGSGAGTAASATRRRIKTAATTLLALWAIATLTGRLLAYTHSILMAREAFY